MLNIWKDKDIIFIEGDTTSLEFLSKLILAQAKTDTNDSISISPKGAGKMFFSKKSQFGLYIHNTKAEK
ncbi:MAG: hypothetical protein LBK66_08815 [Spirochaetaceae bacterium]|nr:hypothetical protein [Spirochaetaceae bacterium]